MEAGRCEKRSRGKASAPKLPWGWGPATSPDGTSGCFPITTRVGSPSFYLEREAPRIAHPDTCSHCVTREVSWEKTPERRPGPSMLGVRCAQYGPKHSSLSARRRPGPEGDGATGNTGHPSSWRQSVSLGEKFQNQEPEQVS